jgi:hypothetical protein
MQKQHDDVNNSLVLLWLDGRLNGRNGPVVTDQQMATTKDMVASTTMMNAWRDDVGTNGEVGVRVAGVGGHG